MSTPDSITTDEFAALRPEDHALAVYLYSQRLSVLQVRAGGELNAEAQQLHQQEQRQCQQLRKVHVSALHEQLLAQGFTELAGEA